MVGIFIYYSIKHTLTKLQTENTFNPTLELFVMMLEKIFLAHQENIWLTYNLKYLSL